MPNSGPRASNACLITAFLSLIAALPILLPPSMLPVFGFLFLLCCLLLFFVVVVCGFWSPCSTMVLFCGGDFYNRRSFLLFNGPNRITVPLFKHLPFGGCYSFQGKKKKMDQGAVNNIHQKEQETNAAIDQTPTTSYSPSTSTSLESPPLQEDSLNKIDVVVEGPSPSEHRANGTQTDHHEREQTQFCTSLYRAALKGNWQDANKIHKKDQWQLPITQQKMNALQVAVAAKQTTFVKKVLNCMTREELEFKNENGDTALAVAALSGSVKIAKEMVKKNDKLPMIRNNEYILPLLTASTHRQRDMVLYLYSVTEIETLTHDERIKLLLDVIFCDLYDVALKILEKNPKLATAEDECGHIALEQLARKPSAIGSRNQMSVWERCIGSCFKGVYHKALMRTLAHQLVEKIWTAVQERSLEKYVEERSLEKFKKTIFLAAELGNIEFLAILIHSDPDLIWMVNEKNQNIFHISIRHRQESIFNLIHEIGVFKDMIATNIDKDRNNMLHLAGELAPVDRLNIVSGAALHLQRELLWFKEIEKIVPPSYLKAENSKGQTPKDLFAKTHAQLHKDGEKWMRGTAMHCMVVATLIATVVFAAAFTVPGGNDQGRGTPIFLEHNWFLVFFISDSIALLSSSTSILIFLSILTSRYTEKDFLSSLPRRLMFGLTALFISIVCMVVAFGATCFLIYQRKVTRVPTVIITLAGVPISSFLLLHYELLIDIISSTYLSKFLFRSRKRMFCYKVEDAYSNN